MLELGDDFELVINCAGMNGGILAGDDQSVFPIRGVSFEVRLMKREGMMIVGECTMAQTFLVSRFWYVYNSDVRSIYFVILVV